MAAGMDENQNLGFTVYKWSSYSGDYLPSNILEDRPSEPKSRWSSNSNQPPQFLLLKLNHMSIVKYITFGKFEQPHVCNMKQFQVYCGLKEDHLTLALEDGLANDSNAETFSLRHTISGHLLPSMFIKIVPLQAYVSSFNFSIWYVQLRGCPDPAVVEPAHKHLVEYRKKEALRVCLKHLRQYNYNEAYENLRKKACVELEHAKLSALHHRLVVEGDFPSAERIMQEAVEEGLLDKHITSQPVEARWTQVEPQQPSSRQGGSICDGKLTSGSTLLPKLPADITGTWPGMRGGHSMCIDTRNEVLYVFGGFDGAGELGDFWKFDVRSSSWIQICSDAGLVGGPPACSCHKMVMDNVNQRIYFFGRPRDQHSKSASHTNDAAGDFFCYDVRCNKWSQLPPQEGGPPPVYDHQMCIDEERQLLFVFGGKTISKSLLSTSYFADTSSERAGYGGLYQYDIAGKEWTLLRKDGRNDRATEIHSRMAHTMVYHPDRQSLYILGGQRDRVQLHDMLVYHVGRNELTMHEDLKPALVDSCGFALRATLDPTQDEMYLLTGLSSVREDTNPDLLQMSLWVCNVTSLKHHNVFSHCTMGSAFWLHDKTTLPCPRFGHHFVFDPVHQVHYLFGGNPGNNKQPTMRLDDLWMLKLVRSSREQILRKAKLLIRQQHYQELAQSDPIAAISYLQTDLSSLVNHDDPVEREQFQALSSNLFAKKDDGNNRSDMHSMRSELYDKLSQYFPPEMAQPSANLTDMLPF